jgi:phosphohistidine phosphatase
MKIVLIRHARAAPRRLLQRDRTRALTADGRRRQRKAVKGLKVVLPEITQLVSSPLLRARETMDILAAEYPDATRETLVDLAPGGALRGFMEWSRQQSPQATVAVVGHEPDIGRLAGWLLTGRQAGFIAFKKGAAALIEFDAAPRAGGGTLRWLLTAGQLADLG